MIYNPSDTFERRKMFNRLRQLIKNNDFIELKKVAKKRTIKQNSYLHKLFSLFGLELGYTMSEAKQLVKIELGFTYQKGKNLFFAETSKMNTKELTDFIDKFRNFASKEGCYLPSADEYNGKYAYFENIIAANNQYL